MGKGRLVKNMTILFSSFLLVVIIVQICKHLGLLNMSEFEQILRNHSSFAKLIFFFICFFQPILLPLPEAITLPAGSTVIGSFQAFIIGFIGSASGIVIMYFLARFGGLKLVSKLIKEKHLKKYQGYVSRNETIILSILFIIPILPDEIICVGAGISKVSFKRFLIISSFSKIITSSVLSFSVYLAKLFSLTPSQLILVSSIIVACILSVSFFIKKLIMKQNSNDVQLASGE